MDRAALEAEFWKYVYPVDYKNSVYSKDDVAGMLNDWDDGVLVSDIAMAKQKLHLKQIQAEKMTVYTDKISAATSMQDITDVFELLWPGTAEKRKQLSVKVEKALAAITTIKDPNASPEALYDAIQNQYPVVDAYDAGIVSKEEMQEFIAKKDELRQILPVRILDNYITTAQDITVRLNSAKAKEAEYKALTAEISQKEAEILAKYEPERKAAEWTWTDLMNNEYNPWQKAWGYGRWQNVQMDVDKYKPWTPESVAEFELDYRTEAKYWDNRLFEQRTKREPWREKQTAELKEALNVMQEKQQAIKEEIDKLHEQTYDAVINTILDKSPVTEAQAEEWSKVNVVYDKSSMTKAAKGGYSKKDIERNVKLFYRMTGGRLPRLEFSTTRSARSCAAHWSGSLFIGHNFGRRTLWHEMAHLLEDDTKIKAAAIAFRDRRKEDNHAVTLRSLVPGSNYGSDELAFKDSWFDAYVGKYYSGGSGEYATEVISMGMQQLSSIPALFKLQEKDPEHLAFMLGLCMSKPSIDVEARQNKQAATQEKVAKAQTQEQFLKDLDKQVTKAGDFWSADGYEIATENNYYSRRKTSTYIKYNKEYDDQGKLRSYNHYTVKSEKNAKRALFLWYKAGKPTGQGAGDMNLYNIIYQLERNTKNLPTYILQTSLAGA